MKRLADIDRGAGVAQLVAALAKIWIAAVLVTALTILVAQASAAAAMTEAEWQTQLCPAPQFETEVVLPNGTRVDCLTEQHAIEIDFSDKWGEALGQALSYSASTGLDPVIFLICRRSSATCLKHRLTLEEAIRHWNLPVEVVPFGGGE